MSWVNICDEKALPCFGGIAAWIENRAIAIFNLREQGLFAICNTDPATGVSLLSRGLICELEGDIFVASPLHKQHYSLTSGQCIEDDSLSVQLYRVRCEDGRVWVQPTSEVIDPLQSGS
ncbi:nitrite reductase small subunit NirD [Shewanella sp. D64]|uniref:nitrite reductase small subunit NirD n=1 Tax=unclassified Shewanella TaxID=196818 RepID=UPI0022BA3AC9|nr:MULTISPECIES: nitrite reductase small subunit NirD [unclassified Shewanella]MEC4725762.1 nitrite reductase small subunit NirD [Shewanella sp. D64]MEC4737631.1 nitrite reductase small subunit NirD [Shewanella sp. E94]WBJ93444.1 nitrite reductase small subunit NirD [Shewanella sp. MTB7]